MDNKDSNFVRIQSIDVAKGLGILLVVLGHSFPDASSTGISITAYQLIYKFIYSFHMPLFFLLAGFLSQNQFVKPSKGKIVIKNTKRYLLPYFIWALIYLPLILIFPQYSNNNYHIHDFYKVFLGSNPYSGLWFLYTIFILSTLNIFLVFKSDYSNIIVLFLSFILLIISKSVEIIEPIKWILAFSFYYIFGKWIATHKNTMLFLLNKLYILFGALIITILSFIMVIEGYNIFLILTGIFGSLTVLSVAQILSNFFIEGFCLKLKNSIIELGTKSIKIYILSGPIQVIVRILCYNFLSLNYHIVVVFMFIFGVFGSILVAILIKKYFPYIEKYIFGV